VPYFLRGEEEEQEFYTYDEASQAVKKLKIRTAREYKRRYKEDSRLPGNPYKFYADQWVSWPHFLRGGNKKGIELYSLIEAMVATRKLGIKTRAEYFRRYKEDSRLPSEPHRFYKNEWVSWPSFLRGRVPKYKTFGEAMRAARSLGIETYTAYQLRYKEDPRLPSSPKKAYPHDWVSWPHFLRGEEK